MSISVKNINDLSQSSLTSTKDVVECLATIKALHPSWKIDNEELIIKLWHHRLRTYPVYDVKKAVLDVASTSKYIPKLADIVNVLNQPRSIHKNPTWEEIFGSEWAKFDALENYEQSLSLEEVREHHRNASLILKGESIGNDFDLLRAELISKIKILRNGENNYGKENNS